VQTLKIFWIWQAIQPLSVFFLTHGHLDHIGALKEIKSKTKAPVCIHPLDARLFNIQYDMLFSDRETIHIGKQIIHVIHTPGHTPGMVSLRLDKNRVIVGDTIFVGGPGRTNSPEDFKITMQTMQNIVFTWTDETVFYPGHGEYGNIGKERRSFEKFVILGWSPKLCGDVTWE